MCIPGALPDPDSILHALLCSAVPIFWVPWILASAFHLQASAECETAAGAVNIPGVCVLDETTTIEGLQRAACEGAS